jgi:hypothetical protein
LKKRGYPPGYRVLCFNCNRGRYLNGGVCPHEIERDMRNYLARASVAPISPLCSR